MKYIYLLTALIFMGCGQKTVNVEKAPEVKTNIEVAQVSKPIEVKEEVGEVLNVEEVHQRVPEVVTPVLRKNETIIDEPKVVKNITSDVAPSCAMWSDGSNICTRISKRKASCTTNPVAHRMFSCLQWQ